MKGFLKNKSNDWVYALKRSIRPGGEVPLEELYEQYGVKHSIEPGKPFVDWLRTIKLRNSDQWEIVYDFDITGSIEPVEETSPVGVLTSTNNLVETEDNTPMHKSDIKRLSVDDVALLSVRKARNVVPKIMDLKLLQYALSEARQLSDKDSLCRLLERRIKELQIAR